MSKAMSILGSVLFFVAAPVVVAGLVPWWIMRWEFQPAFLGFEVTRVIGVMLIIAGIPGLVDSFARFALQGLGTPAPIAPTQNLVVTGLYRYVRNPIYIALVSVTVGQALLFGDGRLLWYGAVVWLVLHVSNRAPLRDSGKRCGRGQATIMAGRQDRGSVLFCPPSVFGRDRREDGRCGDPSGRRSTRAARRTSTPGRQVRS